MRSVDKIFVQLNDSQSMHTYCTRDSSCVLAMTFVVSTASWHSMWLYIWECYNHSPVHCTTVPGENRQCTPLYSTPARNYSGRYCLSPLISGGSWCSGGASLTPNFIPRYFFLRVKPLSKRLLNLGVLLMFSSVIQCVHKHVHSKSLEPCSLATTKVFVVCNTSQITLMSLGLVSTQVLLIFYRKSSVQLLFSQYSSRMVLFSFLYTVCICGTAYWIEWPRSTLGL